MQTQCHQCHLSLLLQRRRTQFSPHSDHHVHCVSRPRRSQFVPPVTPPAEPVFLNDATPSTHFTEANQLVLVRQRTFRLYDHDAEKALVRQIIAATPVIYLNALNDRQSGFCLVTCLQLLTTHLQSLYGKVTMAIKTNIIVD